MRATPREHLQANNTNDRLCGPLTQFAISRLPLTEVGRYQLAEDLVQDAMIKLVRNYSDKPAEEWTPLFYRILQNNIRDWQRRRAVRARVMVWFGKDKDDDDFDPIAAAPDPVGRTPEEELQSAEAMQTLERAISNLPARQKEAFILRTFEGLGVTATSVAMGCSEGSVKTHYSRAVHKLRENLGEHR